MARAHLLKTITDNAGNALAGATVRVLRPGTNTPVTDPYFGTDAGLTALSNPFTALTGVVSIYMANPTRVTLGVTVGSNAEVLFEDVDVLEPAEGDLQTAAQTPYTSPDAIITADNVQDALNQIYAQAGAGGVSSHAGDGFESTQVGPGAVAASDQGTALGHDANASTFQATALGESAQATGTGALAAGQAAAASANQSTALGTNSVASALRATAVGTEAAADGVNTTAVGYQAHATGIRSTAVGRGATADDPDTFVAAGDTLVVQPSGPASHATQIRVYDTTDAPHTLGAEGDMLILDGTALLASTISFAPAGTIAATDVQAALVELDTEKATPAQIASAVAAHEAAGDPHPQYLTPVEGNAAYDAAGAATAAAAAARAAHEAAADPHPQYLTQIEGDARYTQTTVSSVGTVDEEGVPLTQRGTINFVGRRVTATDDAANNRTNVVIAQPFVKKTANYALVAATDDVVFFDGANLTATLPDPATVTGVQFTVKNQNATPLIVATAASTIDADATRTLAQYDSITVISDGTYWGVV